MAEYIEREAVIDEIEDSEEFEVIGNIYDSLIPKDKMDEYVDKEVNKNV